MSLVIAIVTDLVAIVVLAYALYFRRHRRRDLLLSYVALNVGVLAVTIALGSVEVGIGLGIGLFGILSIIRLRSDQITQQEIAYYFVALALGLLAGLRPTPEWVTPALSAVMLAVMFVVDAPWAAGRTRHHTVMLDRAYPDERDLEAAVAALLNASLVRVEVLELDLVRETTLVDVRYRAASSKTVVLDRARPTAVPRRAEAPRAEREEVPA
ncbi:DUF4956 domain-containing protein [Microbacterium sp.]|uniref:DUF4956 domain-containing protein n=1 Tax=Microbacterium sp. TaxID=51671 RepID=UPI0028110338|nr:DUF4956 domain-containing protein [Microbacterium sp.]